MMNLVDERGAHDKPGHGDGSAVMCCAHVWISVELLVTGLSVDSLNGRGRRGRGRSPESPRSRIEPFDLFE
jgi:hypothetical protein